MLSKQKREQLENVLRENLVALAEELQQRFDAVSDHWGFEDPVYRFYHQSFKVYWLQETTTQIVVLLQRLVPEQPLNDWFSQIVAAGTNKEFQMDDNARWLEVTRPIIEAFFHARYFLEMACRYRTPPEKDQPLPSGWASLLYLFDLR